MAQVNTKEDFNLIKFTPQQWKTWLTDLALRIKTDAKKGIMQNNTSGNRYRSRQYVDYKSRFMAGKTISRKVRPYNAIQVVSNQTAFVDMHLTGKMFDYLLSSAQPDKDGYGGSIGYLSNDSGKVLGNQIRGYDVLGVSKKNTDLIFDDILKAVDQNIRKDFAKTINITIG